MSIESKSPRKVARAAPIGGERTLPKCSHRLSRRGYTLPQFFALLVLREFLKTDYRGICQHMRDLPSLQKAPGL